MQTIAPWYRSETVSPPSAPERVPLAFGHQWENGSVTVVKTEVSPLMVLAGLGILGVGIGVGMKLAEQRPTHRRS